MIIKLLEEYGLWGIVISLVILTVIVMFSDRASGAFQTWLGTDKKEVIDNLIWTFGVIALYGLFKSKESTTRIIKSIKECWTWVKKYGHWGMAFILVALIVIIMLSDRASGAFQVLLGTDKKGVISDLIWVSGAIALYGLFKLKESTTRIIEPLKEYGLWGIALPLAVLIAIVMFFDVSQVWFDADKKEVIGYLSRVIGGVIVLYGLFKFKEDIKKIVKPLKKYGPWVLVVFFITLIIKVMSSDPTSWVFKVWFGTTQKETIEFFGWAIGGVIALYGFLKLEERAQAQSDANDLERFKTATEHLSEKGLDKRSTMRHIASFYEFYYLARNNKDYCEVASNILIACLELMPKNEHSKEKQHLLSVLLEKGKDLWELSDKNIDLQEASLEKMNLENYDLQNVNLRGANLRGASLRNADLRDVDLRDADLRDAKLQGAKLQGAKLQGVNLQGMDLQGIDLQGADLHRAILTRAILTRGNLKGTTLIGAKFDYAILREADLSGSNVRGAIFHYANIKDANMLGMRNYTRAGFWMVKYNANTKVPAEDWYSSTRRMIVEIKK